jgi:transposase
MTSRSPRYELSDGQWEVIREFLPANGRRGQQWKDHRLIIGGILWALSDGGRWRNVPEAFGKWKTVYERFRRWSRQGLWDEILDELQLRKRSSGGTDWELFAIDGSVVRAHQSAAGASKGARPDGEPEGHALGRSQGGFGTKMHLVAAIGGGQVLPLVVAVSPGQEHETQRVVPLVEELDGKGMLPEKLAGDKGYSAKWIRSYLLSKGIEPVIPHQKSEAGRHGPFDREAYRERNLIERGINDLKWLRRVATRYEKLAIHYLGLLKLAILFRFYLV